MIERIDAIVARVPVLGRAHARLALSRAKHPSLAGHVRIGKRIAGWLPYFEYDSREFLCADGCPAPITALRESALVRLASELGDKAPTTIEQTRVLREGLSDLAFTDAYRVPYPFRSQLRRHLRIGALTEASEGVRVRDLDGNWSFDLTGSYGVNVFGLDFYKACIDRAATRAHALGPMLGPLHPVVIDNVRRLRALSGLDEVSFHMSGTEAVMQAVALARYHTGRTHVVRFCGAYHGWWDGVQPGVGNPRAVHDVYTLAEMSEATLRALSLRRDVACVLVNPLQALHPNAAAPGDSTLVNSRRRAGYDKQAYARWLARLREVCTQKGIPLILDEVFLGFRLARGGAQEYFGVAADLVTYGKTLAGGLPVGVVCGRRELMKRYRDDRPSDILFARGTFNAHPYVMTAMNEFLLKLDDPEIRASYEGLDERWDRRVTELNDRLEREGLPVRFANLTSVWTTLYTTPSRYNWMFQFYLRAEGLMLSWVGSGRFIFSHAYRDEDFREVADRIVTAARKMAADGWWWSDHHSSDRDIDRAIMKRALSVLFSRTPGTP
ncbi:MAG: aminotransferase class III-fold pyridoxal phosphate-dependent enzyme [Myxococcota bacterium]